MRDFLVCYNYGMGGIWLYIGAECASDIRQSYPELTVFEAPPAWWTEEMERKTQSHRVSDPFWAKWLEDLGRSS